MICKETAPHYLQHISHSPQSLAFTLIYITVGNLHCISTGVTLKGKKQYDYIILVLKAKKKDNKKKVLIPKPYSEWFDRKNPVQVERSISFQGFHNRKSVIGLQSAM